MSRPIRTLLFSTLYPSSVRPVHGIFVETRLRELLRTSAVETKVVAPVPWFPSTNPRFGEYARMAATPRQETRNGIDVLHPRYPVISKVGMSVAPFLLALASIRPIQRLIDSGFCFDVIDAHYYYPDGVAAAILARRFGKPLTITARGTDLNLIPAYATPRRLMQWAAARADASIGVCNALVDVLRGWGVEEHKLHVMRNGVDLERFKPLLPTEARRRLGLGPGPVLLSVGDLIERKGHHIAVAAIPALVKRFAGVQLLIVGEGGERGRLERQIDRLGLQAHVRLVGAIANADLATWYSAADALILASSREGWANVLLEAMACGTPVLATRIWGGTPEVVADERVGLLLERRDGEALAETATQLLEQPRDRAHVRRYAEKFGWEWTSRAQLSLFERLASQEISA